MGFDGAIRLKMALPTLIHLLAEKQYEETF